MEVLELCEKIGLQPEVEKQVEEISKEFDFGAAEEILKDFHDYDKMKEAWMRLEEKIGEDPEHMKILTCMLKASADAYEIYQKKGIEDSIYFATMKCYTRFLEEAYERTGRYVFDRYWWTGRQAGCHLFRIGELEYEIIRTDGKSPEGDSGISIHIPSDADFSPACVDESLGAAKHFFAEYDPALKSSAYCCHSWLLDPVLQMMLSQDSNIVSFQKRFEITDIGEAGTDYLEWIFKTQETEPEKLPEKTTLQRKVKEHILAGKVIRNVYGRLIGR